MIVFHPILPGISFIEHRATVFSYDAICATGEVKQVFDAEDILCWANNFWWIGDIVPNNYWVVQLRKDIRYRRLWVQLASIN
jgi:hypothetical protein